VRLAKGPVVTQPPPRPGVRYRGATGPDGVTAVRTVSLRPGMNTPLPEREVAEPSKRGLFWGALTYLLHSQ